MRRGEPYIRYRPFASIIPHQARSRAHGTNAGDIDNTPSAPLPQRWHHGGHAQINTLDIDRKHLIELVFGHVHRRLVLIAGPRVVDDDVQAAELRDRRVDDFRPVRRRRHVGGHGRDVCSGCGVDVVDFSERVAVDVARHDFRAFRHEFAGYRQSEPGCCACNGEECE